jgi:hypothetical protein
MSNTFRKTYRELTEAEKAYIEELKNDAEKLAQSIGMIPLALGRGSKETDRSVALALTNLEQAVMWAEKAAT